MKVCFIGTTTVSDIVLMSLITQVEDMGHKVFLVEKPRNTAFSKYVIEAGGEHQRKRILLQIVDAVIAFIAEPSIRNNMNFSTEAGIDLYIANTQRPHSPSVSNVGIGTQNADTPTNVLVLHDKKEAKYIRSDPLTKVVGYNSHSELTTAISEFMCNISPK